MKTQVNKVKVVSNNYKTDKAKQKKDTALNCYVFERTGNVFAYDVKSGLRNFSLFGTDVEDNAKKTFISSFFAPLIMKELKKEFITAEDVTDFVHNLLCEKFKVKAEDLLKYYK